MEFTVWLKGKKESQRLDLSSDFASNLATPVDETELFQLARLMKVQPLMAFGGNAEKPRPRPRKQLLEIASALQAGWKKHQSRIKPYLSDAEFMKQHFEADFSTLVAALKKKGDPSVYFWAELS
jgi:hypothetical protein